MMGHFIKLNGQDGLIKYINASMIVAITAHHSNGSKIRIAMSEITFDVAESPDEVIKLIKSGGRNYL